MSHTYLGDQPLEALAPGRRRAGLTLIVVDDGDLVVTPTESDCPPTERILPLGTLDVLDHLSHRRLANVQVRTALEMARLDFRRLVHGVPQLPVFMTIAASTWMMVLRLQSSIGRNGIATSGVGRLLVAASVCAQPHMPRRKNSTRPLRDSGSNASPSVDMRRISYSATMVGSRGEHSAAVFATSVMFFFH
jgi:hypothetical protein